MRERPILFSGPMVRAILEGRKSQTRCVVKPQPVGEAHYDAATGCAMWSIGKGDCGARCPYGAPGDRLWVREAHSIGSDAADRQILATFLAGHPSNYLIGDGPVKHPDAPEGSESWCLQWKRRPSIHMPRWACRIVLEITGVRVERLQDISREDAAAEGICWCAEQRPLPEYIAGSRWPEQNYLALWDHINGPGSAASNPWVWVVEFKRSQPQPNK